MEFSDRIRLFLRTRSWQEYVLVLAIVVYLSLQVSIVQNLQQLPAPLYGGDIYLQHGMISHIAYGGNPFKDYRTSDPVPNYSPLYALIVGGFARIFSIDPLDAMYLFSYLFLVLSMILLYTLAYLLTHNKTVALLAPLLYTPFYLTLKYTEFTQRITFPLFFIVLFITLFEKDKKKQLLLACLTSIVYGLLSLSHGSMFPTISVFLVLISLYVLFFKYTSFSNSSFYFNKKHFKENFWHNLSFSFLLLIFGLLLAQLHWFAILKSIFLDNAQHFSEIINTSTIAVDNPLEHIFEPFLRLFGAFSTPFEAILSLLTICSVLFLFFAKSLTRFTLSFTSPEQKSAAKQESSNSSPKAHTFELQIPENTQTFLKLVLLGSLLIPFLFVIVLPFFGVKIDTLLNYIVSFWTDLPKVMLVFFALFIFFTFIERISKWHIAFALVCVLLIGANVAHTYQTYLTNDPWYRTGKTPLFAYLAEMKEYIVTTSDVNDVILTNKELGFSLNSLTGRKLVAHPNGQKNWLYDFNRRELDLAIMLQGNDSEKRKELFEKYDVKYFYWDIYWIKSEVYQDQNGQIVLFDPILILDLPENRQELDKYGVKYTPQYLELNPNFRNTGVTKYNVLLVFSMPNLTHPWSSELDPFLTLEKEASMGGQIVAQLYTVTY